MLVPCVSSAHRALRQCSRVWPLPWACTWRDSRARAPHAPLTSPLFSWCTRRMRWPRGPREAGGSSDRPPRPACRRPHRASPAGPSPLGPARAASRRWPGPDGGPPRLRRLVHGSFRSHPRVRTAGGRSTRRTCLARRWRNATRALVLRLRGWAPHPRIAPSHGVPAARCTCIHGGERGLARATVTVHQQHAAHGQMVSVAVPSSARSVSSCSLDQPDPRSPRRACRWSPVAPVSRWIVGMGRIT